MLIKKKRIPIKHLILIGFLPSFVKKVIYRLKGYRIGSNVSIGLGSVIIGVNVEIRDNSSIGFFSIINTNKLKIDRFVKIGSFVYIDVVEFEIGEDSKIREYVYVGGLVAPESKLKLGKRCSILQYSFLNPTKSIIFGDDCGVGGCCKLFTHGSFLSILEGFPVTFAPIIVGDNVWIAWDVLILPGVTIGNDVVIGAGSLVKRNISSNSLAIGNPAKVKVTKFPFSNSETKRKRLLIGILNEFIDYLSSNRIKTEKQGNENNKLIFIISNKYQLIYCEYYSIHLKFLHNKNILVIFDSVNIENIYNNNEIEMIISIQKKERIGTSVIGEEFCRFISRYGIRCNRLD